MFEEFHEIVSVFCKAAPGKAPEIRQKKNRGENATAPLQNG